MLLSNPHRPDPRVAREAAALIQAGYRVTLVAWDREAEYPQEEELEGLSIVRIQNVRSGYGNGFRQIFRIPQFWMATIRYSKAHQHDVIHCHDLDTLPAGWWIKRTCKIPIVYDAHEDYPAMMSLYLPKWMVGLLSWMEKRFLRQIDLVIAASSQFTKKLQLQGIPQVETIGNFQNLNPFDEITAEEIAAARSRLGLSPEDYVIAYIGGFSRNRLLLPLIEAACSLDNVHVLLFGDGHQREAVEIAVKDSENVRYLGWLSPDQVALHTRLADVIYYCLRPDYPGALFNAPNSLSNAMAAGKPIIANDVGDLGFIVSTTGCGLLLDQVNVSSIRHAIQTLQDPILRREMGENARRAAVTHYNWDVTSQHLIDAYRSLFDTIQ
jgi:glycosyltransferase involved in cell wall biosynthesis